MLQDNIEVDRQTVGLAVGLVDESGVRVVCHGKLDNNTDRDVDGDTLFGIGSITKVFTAVLLQDMVERGEMRLNDPVQKFLPDSVRMPTFQGKEITLLHLATHTSGLPRDSSGDLYPFLSRCRLQGAPGNQRVYSNLGVGLLGHLIARKAEKDYETLVLERICQPLGMNNTCITVPPDLEAHRAAAHAMPGHRVQVVSPTPHNTNSFLPDLRGAGSIRSTANDLLIFISSYAGLTNSSLSSTMRKTMDFHLLESGDKRPLVWESDGDVFEHGGLLKGYQAELAFDVKKRRGVVVLSNCANAGTFVPGVWKALLNGRSPKPAESIPFDPASYDRLVGTYQLDKEADTCTVRRVGERLLIQWIGVPGQRVRIPSFEVYPQTKSVFRNEFREVQTVFHSTSNGTPPQLVFTSLGTLSGFQGSLNLAKISGDVPEPTAPIQVDPEIYDGFVGQYRKTLLFGLIRIGPTLNISHDKDNWGSHLIARVRGLGVEEIFPVSETSFIPGFDVSEALRLTFVRNKKGQTTGVIVFWNGRKLRGTRIATLPH
ncbi:MAG: beta-lactamase family protein [Verrucomicrobiae bacterium]|nr:beta-lactamase family protein [Verrucomicrobiae bacterium]